MSLRVTRVFVTLLLSLISGGAKGLDTAAEPEECVADQRDPASARNLLQTNKGLTKQSGDAAMDSAHGASWLSADASHSSMLSRSHVGVDSNLLKPSTRGAAKKLGAEIKNDGEMSVENAVTPTCRTLINASRTLPDTNCPEECPFWAENVDEANPCMFKCVVANNCGNLNTDPHAKIPDEKGYCRRCMVPGCQECADLPTDNCKKCAPGYMRLEDGSCKALGLVLWAVLLSVCSVLLVVVLVWYGVLLYRSFAAPNVAGVEEGKEYLEKSILLKKTEEGEEEWPFMTNLCSENVAGRGTLLLFNFQAALMVWALLAGVSWGLYVWFTNPDLFHLGRVAAVTPRQYCTVIRWGHDTQINYIWVKYSFCGVLYVVSFIGAIVYAVYQERRFNKLDADNSTMMDFAALASGLPIRNGGEKVEDGLKRDFEKVFKCEIVGVSVCWDLAEKKDEVEAALDDEITTLDQEYKAVSATSKQQSAETSQVEPCAEVPKLGVFGGLADWISSQIGFSPAGSEKEATEDDITEILKEMVTTGSAFVVFKTEEARDKAVQQCKENQGFPAAQFEGGQEESKQVWLEYKAWEPGSILWENFHFPTSGTPVRVAYGCCGILALLVFWVVCFYIPSAVYLNSFTALNGEEPGFLFGTLMTVLVILGNQIMYFMADFISTWVGFRFEDDRQASYVVLYTVACTLQVILDIALFALMSYHQMIGIGVHTATGELLSSLELYEDIFESYAMQKALGKQLFDYSILGTFLIPFLIEPIGTIFGPCHVQRLLVYSTHWVRGRDAEKSMAYFTPMDLSRYGDLLLNVMLCVLMIFFPPGWLLQMFLGLSAAHVYIYFFDHYRVLRAIPEFEFTSDRVDAIAQTMLAVIIGIILAGFVFKSNCQDGLPCARGGALLFRVVGAAAFSIFIHIMILKKIVPVLGAYPKGDDDDMDYATVAKDLPCNWFTANPVGCLRSKHIYKEKVPCVQFVPGKEHLLKANPAWGNYFKAS